MKPKILFIGGTPRGFELMRNLLYRDEKVVYAVILNEDEHEMIKVAPQIRELCREHNIANIISKRIEKDSIAQILNTKPDVAFVNGWRTIIPEELFSQVPLGFLAAHDSLLPRYRGFAPTPWAIINGEKETGVTLFKIDSKGVDAGDVFRQKVIPINENETSGDIYPRIVKAAVELYQEFLEACAKNEVSFYPQDETQATYACKRTPADGRINWNRDARHVFNFIRALTPPYPYAWTMHDEDKIRIKKAVLPHKELDYQGNIPGRIVGINDDGVIILCRSGQVIIKEIITEDNETVLANHYFTSITTTLC